MGRYFPSLIYVFLIHKNYKVFNFFTKDSTDFLLNLIFDKLSEINVLDVRLSKNSSTYILFELRSRCINWDLLTLFANYYNP